jgi:hypothetical protein
MKSIGGDIKGNMERKRRNWTRNRDAVMEIRSERGEGEGNGKEGKKGRRRKRKRREGEGGKRARGGKEGKG